MTEETKQEIYLTRFHRHQRYGCFIKTINGETTTIKGASPETIADSMFRIFGVNYDFKKKIILFDRSDMYEMPEEVKAEFGDKNLATPYKQASGLIEERIRRLIKNSESNKSSTSPK